MFKGNEKARTSRDQHDQEAKLVTISIPGLGILTRMPFYELPNNVQEEAQHLARKIDDQIGRLQSQLKVLDSYLR